MRSRLLVSARVFGTVMALTPAAAYAVPGDSQYYAGTLFSPPTPLPKAGKFYIEPYLYFGSPLGRFGSQGNYQPLDTSSHSVSSLVIVKYAVTDRISVYVTPQVQYQWGSGGSSSGIQFTDLPLVLQGVVLDRQGRMWSDAWQHSTLTVDIGMNFPTGKYDRLTRADNASGSGAYSFRYGLIDQTGFKIGAGRPFRVRLWALGVQPVSTVTVRGASTYGTGAGFYGHTQAEAYGNAGGAIEFSLTKHVVLALDLFRDWASGAHVSGQKLLQRAPMTSRFSFNTPANDDWFAAPALEYNWNATTAMVAGVGITLSGRDTTRQVIGTVAFERTF